MKKKGINSVASTRKPVVVGKFIVVAQEYIKGDRLSKWFRTKDGEKLRAGYQRVRETMHRYGISDIHNQNVIFDEVNGRLVVIDLGDGVL